MLAGLDEGFVWMEDMHWNGRSVIVRKIGSGSPCGSYAPVQALLVVPAPEEDATGLVAERIKASVTGLELGNSERNSDSGLVGRCSRLESWWARLPRYASGRLVIALWLYLRSPLPIGSAAFVHPGSL